MLRLATLIALLTFAASAHAQTAPKGWKLETTPNLWMATAPEQVRLVFYPAVKSRATFVYWFEDEGLRRTYGFGLNVRAQGPALRTMEPDAGAFMAQTRTISAADKSETAVQSYAWETPKGRQLVQIVMPVALAESPAYKAAFEEITRAWRAGVAYVPAKPAD
jgi:hypothetical protein